MKFIYFMVATAASLALVYGWTPKETSTELPIYRKALYLVPQTFDPVGAMSTAEHAISNLIYEGLFTVNDQLEVVPSLLESWGLNEQGTVYTFVLRKGVKFEDGSDLTLADVIAMLDRVRAPSSPVRETFKSIQTVMVADEHTLSVTLSKPYPPFTSLLAAPMSRVTKKANARAFPLGTGPFKFDSFRTEGTGGALTLTRNIMYRGEPAKIKNFELWQMSEDDALRAVTRGFIHDTINFLSPSGAAVHGSRVKEISAPSATTWVIGMNTAKSPTSDLRLRECLAFGFPKKVLLDTYLKDHQEGFGFLPPILLGSNTEKFITKDAPSSCSDFSTTTLVLDYPEELKNGDKMCEMMRDAWAKMGIPVECQSLSFNNLVTRFRNEKSDLSFLAATLDLPDVEFFLAYFQSTSQFNFSNYYSKSIDKMLALSRAEPDRFKRAIFYENINRELYDKTITINISYPNHVSYHHTCVTGLRLDFSGEYYVDYTKVGLKKGCPYDQDFK